MSANVSNGPSPEEARVLLAQASQSESTTRAGASWPQIAGLLSLGAASSLALPAIVYVPSGLLVLPMSLLMLWVSASFVFMTVFNRSVKRGFGKRWTTTIVIWGIFWIVSILGTSTWFLHQTWFLVVACVALTLVTLLGAWIEAKR